MMLMHDDACCMMMRDSLSLQGVRSVSNEQDYDVQHDAAEHPVLATRTVNPERV